MIPTRTDLPGYLGCPSQHAIPADTAGTMGGLRRLSGPPLAAFAIQVAARLSGAFGFDAHWMGFTFVMACRFRRCPACRFGLAASSRTSLSVANRLIRPAGLSPAWLPASPAHTRTPKLRWRSSLNQPLIALILLIFGKFLLSPFDGESQFHKVFIISLICEISGSNIGFWAENTSLNPIRCD